MPEQFFPAGESVRVMLSECRGDLRVERWGEQQVAIECDEPFEPASSEGDALVFGRLRGDVSIRMPANGELHAENVRGSADIAGILSVVLGAVDSYAEIKEISGAVELGRVGDYLELDGAGSLTLTGDIGNYAEIHGVSGPIELKRIGDYLEVHRAGRLVVNGDVGNYAELMQINGEVELQRVGDYVELKDVHTAILGRLGGNLEAHGVGELLHFGSVDGDCEIRGNGTTVVTGDVVGGDLDAAELGSLELRTVGGSAEVYRVRGDARIASIGGDAELYELEGSLAVQHIGGDAEIRAIGGALHIARVGGELELTSSFPAGSSTNIVVGGDAEIRLPKNPSLSLRATVGGDIRGQRLVSSGGRGVISVVYGDGAAQLSLVVGGDLELSGGDAPRASSVSASNWAGLEAEMDRLGEEFERMGEEFEARFGAEFGERFGEKWSRKAEEIGRKAEERARKAEERARRIEERVERQVEQHADRFRVRINDREWVFDRDRIERLKEEARRAAREGIAGAMQAIERAFAGMGVPPEPPPAPDAPDAPDSPHAPYPPRAPHMPLPPQPPRPPATGQTIRIDVETEAASGATSAPANTAVAASPAPTVEAERAAILQMVAEGRISPEEGDMLLDALG